MKSESEAVDPVCGMRVNPAKTSFHVDHAGERYFFCSAGCKDSFEKDPEKHARVGH